MGNKAEGHLAWEGEGPIATPSCLPQIKEEGNGKFWKKYKVKGMKGNRISTA